MKALVALLVLLPSLAFAAGGELSWHAYGPFFDQDGNTDTGNEMAAVGDALVTHDLNVLNDCDVYGNCACHNDLTVADDITAGGFLSATGGASFGTGLTVAGQTVLGNGVCRDGSNGGNPCTSPGDCPDGIDPRPGYGFGNSFFCDSAVSPSLLNRGTTESQLEVHGGGSVAGDGTAVVGASPAYSGTTQLGNGVLLAQACANNANTAPTVLMQRSRGVCDMPTGPGDLTQLGLWDIQGYDPLGVAYFSTAQVVVEAIEGATGWGSGITHTGFGARMSLRVMPKGVIPGICNGGTNDLMHCAATSECPGGICTTNPFDFLTSTNKAKANAPRGLVVCKTATPTPSVTSTAATPTAPAATLTATPTATSTVGLKDTCPETQVESLDAVHGITLNGGVAVCQQNGVNCPPTFTATPTTSPTPTITVTATLPVPLEIGGASPTATPTATSTAATSTPTGVTPTPTATWTPTVEVNGSGILNHNDYYWTEDRSHVMRVQARNNSGVGNVRQSGQDMTVGAGDSGPGASGFAAGGTYCTESGGSNGGHSIYARFCAAATNLNVTKAYADGNFTSRNGVGSSSPTIASCGTTPSIAGTNNSFTFTVGNPNASSACVVTWGSSVTLSNAPNCGCNYDSATTIGVLVVQPTTTNVTITNDALGTGIAAAFSTGAIVRCVCIGRE